ncbi:aminotransferase class I/II-fold pyridoxal phosphate-dependent enzyme [Candidatus Woesearchaeota archaeon]|nr:aminotransferase class I/II-fold pyridoxal phosphate-dependent enzyme [Candidatus Woesearchaeota archaeon]
MVWSDEVKEHYKKQAELFQGSKQSTMMDVIIRDKEIQELLKVLNLVNKNLGSTPPLLEIGCGNGFFASELERNDYLNPYYGVDFSNELLDIAKKRNLKKAHFQWGDALHLDFPDNSFSLVITERCLINLDSWESQQQALKEIARVLKPNGYFLMVESFTDGWDELNKARDVVGLEPIPQPFHNHFFDKKKLREHNASLFKEVNVGQDAHFLSTYYFGARVLYPSLMDKSKGIVYNNKFVEFFSFLPAMGNYSSIQMLVFQKEMRERLSQPREMIPITKPTLPSYEEIEPELRSIFASGLITNHKYVQKLERSLQEFFGVKHVIAVSSCTSGLMLVMKALGLKGEVIVPSFTFSATGHAILWNGLKPVFVEVDPETYTIDPQKVREAITDKTSAILGVHLFGCPANVIELEKIAKEHNIKLIFDAAHALGSRVGSRNVSTFGDAEVFSCSPTKLLVTGEGGIVTTNDDDLARKIRIGRVYGDPGDYNCHYPGLSSRMSEFHALLGLHSLAMLKENIRRRNELVAYYKKQLGSYPGISFQKIGEGAESTHKDFSLLIDPALFGVPRDELSSRLLEKGIQTKNYFYPPLHQQDAYRDTEARHPLQLTETISQNIISLPLYSHMTPEEIDFICDAIGKIRGELLNARSKQR